MSLPTIFEIKRPGKPTEIIDANKDLTFINTVAGLQTWLNTLNVGVFTVIDYGLNVLGESMISISLANSASSVSVFVRNEYIPLVCRPLGSKKLGCIEPLAINYDPTATVDNGTCEYPILPPPPAPPVGNKLSAVYETEKIGSGRSQTGLVAVQDYDPNNNNTLFLVTDMIDYPGVAVYYNLTISGFSVTVVNNTNDSLPPLVLEFQINYTKLIV